MFSRLGFGINGRHEILNVETVTTITVRASNGEIFTISRDQNGGKHVYWKINLAVTSQKFTNMEELA